MLQPGETARPQPTAEDSFLDLLVESLDGLDQQVRAQFLQRFFKTITQVELTDTQSVECWDQSLSRRQELSEGLGKRVSLKTAIVDVLQSSNFLRVPILVEYEDFKKLQINAATDPLTGLYNRRLFDEYCEKELNRAKRYGQHLALVILDLHKLKEVNDRFGHLQGDRALQLAASTLRKTLRASDFAFRIGGDEFALLLPQADPEQATTLCRRVRTHYESEVQQLKLDVPVTLDFGVAVFPQDGDQKEGLLRLADERLYNVKGTGRTNRRVVPIEPSAPREAPPEAVKPPAPHEVPAAPSAAKPPAATPPYVSPSPVTAPGPAVPERRKWERVSLAGTHAYAVLGEGGQKTAGVIDLSYGGVALILDKTEEFSSPFYAVLHVPILPPVRVSLRKSYTQREEGGRIRVGCSFVA
jgi:diguanylate cyclase (GGDEF)-like protein